MYIALSETWSEITSVARSHGWDLGNLAIFELSALEQQLAEEAQNTVYHPADVDLNKTTHLLLQHIQQVKPRRLVLDSLSELRLMSDSALRYRRQMLSLKQFFAGEQTGSGEIRDRERVKASGVAEGYFVKPLTADNVAAILG